jgi:hypothetical protein
MISGFSIPFLHKLQIWKDSKDLSVGLWLFFWDKSFGAQKCEEIGVWVSWVRHWEWVVGIGGQEEEEEGWWLRIWEQ